MMLLCPTRLPAARVLVAALAIAALAATLAHAGAREEAFLARLAAHVRQLEGVDPQARQIVDEALADTADDVDAESLRIEVLTLLSEPFREAMDAYDGDDYAAAIEALAPLENDADPFLRAAARAYTARSLVQLARLVEAEARITTMLDEGEEALSYGLDEIELRYMLAYCLVQNLKHEQAETALETFLREYPDAPPRLAVTARQMLAELRRRVPESMGEVADLMNFSATRLSAADASPPVREAQDKVVALLDQLIEQAEEAEQQAQQMADAQQQNRDQQQQQQQQQNPHQPAPQSTTPQGDPNAGARRTGRRATPGEAWGALPEAQREQILQVLRERFPGRYRALVEQYYQSLAEEP